MHRQLTLVAVAGVYLSAAQVSDDFEDGWDETTWPTYANDCDQGGTVTLDSTTANSGSNSIRVDAATGYCGHKFFGTTDIPSGDIYVRVYVKTETALDDSHVTFITMPDAAQGDDKHLRIGGQSQILMYNHESDDATLPDLSPQGIAESTTLPTDAFQCLEYFIGTDGSISTWLNSEAIEALTITPGVTNDVATQWQAKDIVPEITGIYFGWESYSGAANTYWYDDVAIDSTRIGCLNTTASRRA